MKAIGETKVSPTVQVIQNKCLMMDNYTPTTMLLYKTKIPELLHNKQQFNVIKNEALVYHLKRLFSYGVQGKSVGTWSVANLNTVQ